MTAQILALFNQSGGVGKTTLTMNLAYHLAQRKQRVLLVDMDPQASLTTFMGLNPFELQQTVQNSLLNKDPLPIQAGIHDCDIVPANIYLSQAEMQLFHQLRREYRLRDRLKEVESDYDYILLDCPPSLGLLSVMCLVAANYLLIPIQTEYKSVEATINLIQTTYEVVREANPNLRIAGAIPTMYDERTSQGRIALDTIETVFEQLKSHDYFKPTVVFPPIPRRTDFANAAAMHQPLAVFAPRNDANKVLETITNAIANLP